MSAVKDLSQRDDDEEEFPVSMRRSIIRKPKWKIKAALKRAAGGGKKGKKSKSKSKSKSKKKE